MDQFDRTRLALDREVAYQVSEDSLPAAGRIDGAVSRQQQRIIAGHKQGGTQLHCHIK